MADKMQLKQLSHLLKTEGVDSRKAQIEQKMKDMYFAKIEEAEVDKKNQQFEYADLSILRTGNTFEPSIEEAEQLNEIGLDRWEMVTLHFHKTDTEIMAEYIFKRVII